LVRRRALRLALRPRLGAAARDARRLGREASRVGGGDTRRLALPAVSEPLPCRMQAITLYGFKAIVDTWQA
jgi:hypothetical protein